MTVFTATYPAKVSAAGDTNSGCRRFRNRRRRRRCRRRRRQT